MKSKFVKHIGIFLAAALSFSAVSVAALAISSTRSSDEVAEVQAADHYTPTTTYEVSNTSAKLSTYYDGLSSLSSSALLTQLRTLDSNKRHSFSYGNMGAYAQGSSSNTYYKSPFIYTDYVTSTNTDSNGMPYSTTISSFYTGGSIGSSGPNWNKEHVWPKSLGGSNVENNLLMPRPTLQSENSSRGNSPFVEGKNSSSGGWDPETAFSSNYFPGIRGECARIIFYCVVASSSLNLVDTTSTNSSTMGKISDLMKWHYAEPPTQREINRNNGAQYIQGNRNPFVDHPEYVTKIWGTQNSSVPGSSSTIASYCTSHESTYTNWVPGSSSSGSSSSTDPSATIAGSSSVTVGSSISLTASLSNVTSASLVTWESSDTTKATVTQGTTSTTSSVASVTGVAAGSVTIRCKYNGTIIGSKSITVTSSSSGGGSDGGYADSISVGDQVVLVSKDISKEMTGWSTTSTIYGIGTEYNETPAGTLTFTVAAGTTSGTYSFKNGSKYLNWSSSNSLSSATSTSSNTSWNVSFDSNKNATITNAADSARQIWWNVGSPRFACYTGKSAGTDYYAVQLYKVGSAPTEKTLTSISLNTTNVQTSFVINSTFNYTGLVVTANYSDGSDATVTPTSVSSPSMTTGGQKTVTVTYTEKDVTKNNSYNIYVISSISASVSKTYIVGETITASDITVKDNFNNELSGFTFSDYQFVYGDAASGGALTNKTFTNGVTYETLSCSLTVQVQRQAHSSVESVTDTITAADLPATDTTYTDFSNVAKSSNARYAGNSAKNGDNIQMRSKNSNSGIVSTTSGGIITSVTINVGSGSNTINVYGKNTTYTDATDLYDTSKQGTLIDSTSSTKTITFTDSYQYVGIRSNSGAIYISSIVITYGGGETPTNVANYIMYEDTNGQCETKFDVAKGYFESMSAADRATFMTSTDYVISQGRERFMDWAKHHGKSIVYNNGDYVISGAGYFTPGMFSISESNYIAIIIIITTISVASIGGYLALRRRKEQ